MRIRLVWVGKTREPWLAEGIEKYLRLLRTMAEVSVIEVKEEKAANREEGLRREGKRIMEAAPSGFILMDERGKEASSTEYAAHIRDRSRLDIVLGGAYGVSDEVKAAASEKMALTRMTLTHEMARLLALEQTYRALSINAGRAYHH